LSCASIRQEITLGLKINVCELLSSSKVLLQIGILIEGLRVDFVDSLLLLSDELGIIASGGKRTSNEMKLKKKKNNESVNRRKKIDSNPHSKSS